VSDQLGTPRIIFDQSGSLATTKRHDYAPFGEELFNGLRTSATGYAAADSTRQKFTSKERDNETGLDYFGARYYSSTLGRFTSIDPMGVKFTRLIDPQQLNRYAYARNNPLKYSDPDGCDLKLAPGLKKGDADRLMKAAIKIYRKESGRAAIDRLEKSDIIFTIGTGRLPDRVNLMAGVIAENFGATERVNVKGDLDAKTGKVTQIDRNSGEVHITLDLEKRDNAQSAYEHGLQSAPDSEKHLFGHELGHADDMNNDMVKEYNQSNEDAEKNAETLANKIDSEKDSMSEADAEKNVRKILDLPPKEEKKKND
jgi:RHS repeat-associated protein